MTLKLKNSIICDDPEFSRLHKSFIIVSADKVSINYFFLQEKLRLHPYRE